MLAVVGDSTAMALDPGFVDLAHRRGWGYVLAAKEGCAISGLPFMLHYPQPPLPGQADCAKDPDGRLHRMLDTYHPSIVFALSHQDRLDYVAPDGTMVSRRAPQWPDGVHAALRHFAEQVTQTGAVLVTPGLLPDTTSAKACLEPHPDPKACAGFPATANPTDAILNSVYGQVAGEVPGVRLVAMQERICPNGTCPMVIDGLVVRYDGVHFTPQGARWFVSRMEPQLVDAALPR
ncbi:hypothetical protein HC031_32200 [Planosporangium thailandense]|uniref:SGNH domain-containing protein n=1 Tax=Planosporangium thailandense TaxID=765197 RepID=A0ABX0Y7D3_9ACTN|nr:hypothetical protein [Planosporangium thailandense]